MDPNAQPQPNAMQAAQQMLGGQAGQQMPGQGGANPQVKQQIMQLLQQLLQLVQQL